MDCGICMSDQEFDEFATLARSITPEDRVRHEPPPELWSRIAAGLVEDSESATDTEQTSSASSDQVIDLATHRPNSDTPLDLTSAEELAGGDPRFSSRLLLVAAAALVAILLGGSLIIASTGGDANTVYAADISNTDLPEPFDGAGTVTLEIDDDPMIVIDFDTDVPTDENVEIWILRADGSEIIPVGTVEPGDTTWDWPTGFDPAEFPLIDLSIEPDDGDPTHSGRSILRGELTTS